MYYTNEDGHAAPASGARWQLDERGYAALDPGFWSKYGKRAFDVVAAIGAIIFFAPFLVLISLVLFVCHGGPVFYTHQRIGKGGVPFGCLKFRTMHTDADRMLQAHLARDPRARIEWETSGKLKHDPRILPVGHFLRKSSLDELPQFFNVLRGDMSVVGPRPIPDSESKHYGSEFVYYKAMRPGITGLWQVSGRSDTTYEERVELDVRYFRARCLALDLQILVRTVGVVLFLRGAY